MFSCHPTDKKLQHFHKTGSLFVCGRHLIVLIFKCLNRFNGNAFTLIFMLFEWFSKESLSKKKLEEKNTHKLYIMAIGWPDQCPPMCCVQICVVVISFCWLPFCSLHSFWSINQVTFHSSLRSNHLFSPC